jgi:cytochrome c peroxidase
MGNESAQEVIDKIKLSSYANDFESLFGLNVLNDSDRSYNYVADAIAAFERSSVFSPFTAKFDRVRAGTESFTAAEERGRNLFRGKAECALCHNNSQGTLVFSDFRYKNIGVPSNPLLPAFIDDPSFVDLGLGAVTGDSRNNGQFRTSSLRNIAITAPYMHNGVFNTLEEVLDFYNTRDTTFTEAPEVSENLDQVGNIGELNLTANEISDLIAFLNTMTDQ